MGKTKYSRHQAHYCWSRNPALTDLLTLQSGNVLTLFVINQERNLFIDVLTLLYGDLGGKVELNLYDLHLVLNIMADWLLVSLQLQVTNNIRDLLAGLLRQLPVYLVGNFVTFLSENGPTAGRGGQLLVGDVVGPGGRFSCSIQSQQGLVRTQTHPGLGYSGLSSSKPNTRSLAGPLAG